MCITSILNSIHSSTVMSMTPDTTSKKYICVPCSWMYDPSIGDPEHGIEPGTAFEDIPEDWVCPICGLGKDAFQRYDE